MNVDGCDTLAISPPALILGPPSLPSGIWGTPYNQSISASGGTASYSYSISAGTLPAGLTLASNGTLSGNPSATGTFFRLPLCPALAFGGPKFDPNPDGIGYPDPMRKSHDQMCWDAIWHQAASAIESPLIPWQNRPTFQQVVEFPRHRPR